MNARQARALRVTGPARRTYLCLEGQRRKPSDYEITTTALLYYPSRGFEVETPVWQHYVDYQRNGQLRSPSWESFEDPSHTTYSTYVARRRDQEAFLDRLFDRPAGSPSKPLQALLGFMSALRFPLHGLQMVAAYVGALAPSGRISVVSAFQSADELRRIQRLCQWLSRSGVPVSELDALGRELWQQHAGFQPLRRLIEELLVTYDWGEALIGLNAVIKPVLDRLLFRQLATFAKHQDDEVLEQTLRSLAEDGDWHAAWSMQLLRGLSEGEPGNAATIARSVVRFRSQMLTATEALLGAGSDFLAGEQHAMLAELMVALDQHLAPLAVAKAKGEPGNGASA
jgi:toluene monooxygenase system protein E